MRITYYDKQEHDFVSIKNVRDIIISLDYETGFLKLDYKVERLYFSQKMPITTVISIGDEND